MSVMVMSWVVSPIYKVQVSPTVSSGQLKMTELYDFAVVCVSSVVPLLSVSLMVEAELSAGVCRVTMHAHCVEAELKFCAMPEKPDARKYPPEITAEMP